MRDTVSPETAAFVFARDGNQCVAPRLGSSIMDCGGTLGLEHVQDGYGRMGRRAASDPAHLVVLCELHREPGMRRGYVWCTDKANRAAMREYLAGVTA